MVLHDTQCPNRLPKSSADHLRHPRQRRLDRWLGLVQHTAYANSPVYSGGYPAGFGAGIIHSFKINDSYIDLSDPKIHNTKPASIFQYLPLNISKRGNIPIPKKIYPNALVFDSNTKQFVGKTSIKPSTTGHIEVRFKTNESSNRFQDLVGTGGGTHPNGGRCFLLIKDGKLHYGLGTTFKGVGTILKDRIYLAKLEWNQTTKNYKVFLNSTCIASGKYEGEITSTDPIWYGGVNVNNNVYEPEWFNGFIYELSIDGTKIDFPILKEVAEKIPLQTREFKGQTAYHGALKNGSVLNLIGDTFLETEGRYSVNTTGNTEYIYQCTTETSQPRIEVGNYLFHTRHNGRDVNEGGLAVRIQESQLWIYAGDEGNTNSKIYKFTLQNTGGGVNKWKIIEKGLTYKVFQNETELVLANTESVGEFKGYNIQGHQIRMMNYTDTDRYTNTHLYFSDFKLYKDGQLYAYYPCQEGGGNHVYDVVNGYKAFVKRGTPSSYWRFSDDTSFYNLHRGYTPYFSDAISKTDLNKGSSKNTPFKIFYKGRWNPSQTLLQVKNSAGEAFKTIRFGWWQNHFRTTMYYNTNYDAVSLDPKIEVSENPTYQTTNYTMMFEYDGVETYTLSGKTDSGWSVSQSKTNATAFVEFDQVFFNPEAAEEAYIEFNGKKVWSITTDNATNVFKVPASIEGNNTDIFGADLKIVPETLTNEHIQLPNVAEIVHSYGKNYTISAETHSNQRMFIKHVSENKEDIRAPEEVVVKTLGTSFSEYSAPTHFPFSLSNDAGKVKGTFSEATGRMLISGLSFNKAQIIQLKVKANTPSTVYCLFARVNGSQHESIIKGKNIQLTESYKIFEFVWESGLYENPVGAYQTVISFNGEVGNSVTIDSIKVIEKDF